MKVEAKSEVDVLKSQKAATYQLKSYRLGTNQLVDLSNRCTSSLTSEQNELIARMKNTIGAAVSAMESHIKAGTIWCPKSEEELEKTPKSDNSSGNWIVRDFCFTSSFSRMYNSVQKTDKK